MANEKIQKVLASFAAVGARDAERTIECFDQKFVQQDPNIAAGVEGFQSTAALS